MKYLLRCIVETEEIYIYIYIIANSICGLFGSLISFYRQFLGLQTRIVIPLHHYAAPTPNPSQKCSPPKRTKRFTAKHSAVFCRPNPPKKVGKKNHQPPKHNKTSNLWRKEAALNRFITQHHGEKCDLDHTKVYPRQQRPKLGSEMGGWMTSYDVMTSDKVEVFMTMASS